MLVLVPTALLNEDDLIDASLSKPVEMLCHLRGRTNATSPPHVGQAVASPLKTLPDIGLPGRMLTENSAMPERIAKVPEAVSTAPLGFGGIVVYGKTGDHGDIGIDRMANGHAGVRFNDVVVFLHPFAGLLRIDEGKGQGANAVPGRGVNGYAVITPARWADVASATVWAKRYGRAW